MIFPLEKTLLSTFESMKHLPLASFLFLTIAYSGYSQSEVEDRYAFALELEEEALFMGALEEYTIVFEKDNSYKNVAFKKELLEMSQGQKRGKPLDELLALGTTQSSTFLLHLGRIYDHRYEFDKALESWNSFLNSADTPSDAQKELVQEWIIATKVKKTAFANPDDFEIHQLESPINSEFAELSPTYFKEKNELIFASSRNSNADYETFQIFHSINTDGSWGDVTHVKVLGEFERNTANIEVVDDDGKLFLFDPLNGGDLFYSETKDGIWLEPVEFDSKISNTHLESHFFINEHEDRIIFASDKQRKLKGLDLYQSFKDPNNDKWTKPQPFASIINSDLDEDSPYLTHDEHTLYFSSNGHGSIGGFDVFKTELDPNTLTWSEPENLGFPINSPDDEIHFKINSDGQSGYFSSNRLHTKGDYDIYFYFGIEKVKLEGKVVDLSTKNRLANVDIVFTPSQYEDEKFRASTDSKGNYATELIANETYVVEIRDGDNLIYKGNFTVDNEALASIHIKDFIIE